MSILLDKGNAEEVFKVLNHHNINSAGILDDKLKVLEIIKEKGVDVFRLKKLDFNTFNQLQRSCKLPELTQEEFDLLKRWSK